MFNQNSLQSNRERNWFKVGWLLYNFQVFYTPSKNNSLSLNLFGLKANRYALGFRTNRVSQIDSFEERDLIKSDFNNFGFEAKYLKKYLLNNHQSAFLIGTKFYKADNYSEQGPDQIVLSQILILIFLIIQTIIINQIIDIQI